MGLDMSVFKYNKKMDEETFDNVMLGKEYNKDYDTFIKESNEVLKVINGDYNSPYFLELCKESLNRFAYDSIIEEPMSEEEYNNKESEYPEYENYQQYLKEHNDKIENKRKRIYLDLLDVLKEKEKQKKAYDKVKDLLEELGESKEVCYWRKHSDLNGYMENLYYEKDGKGDFNCVPLLLTKEDVKYIIIDHKKHLDSKDSFKIEEARGFFWGESSKEDWEESLKDFEKLLKETDWDNSTVYYSCWW